MAGTTRTLKTCDKGHRYYRSSDCPTCPKCQAAAAPGKGFLSRLSAPARSALEHEGITTPEKLSRHTEKEILKIHGIGPASMPTLREVLKEAGRTFASE